MNLFETGFTAPQRLQKVAEVFNPFSKRFLHQHARYLDGPFLDLGCGTGFTTQMLSMSTRSGEVYGIDRSDDHISAAMQLFNQCVFVRHDVTKTPLPVNANTIYSRFILSHVQNPLQVVSRWIDELPVRGILIIEELEGIETDVDVFRKYLLVQRWLMASRKMDLFPGEELAGGTYVAASRLVNECSWLRIRNIDAAEIFLHNIRNEWEKSPLAKDILFEDEIREIASGLQEVIGRQDQRSEVVCKMRRMVLLKD